MAALTAALEMLGYIETNHGFKVLANSQDWELWNEAIDAKFYGKGKLYGRKEWDALLGQYMAVSDSPHILFVEDLVAAYPEAKVILTTRDADNWWRSFDSTVMHSGRVAQPPFYAKGPLKFLDPNAVAREFWRRPFELFFEKPFEEVTPEIAKAAYERHNARVRELVHRESGRLLEYRVGEGWERLCAFLGKEVPEKEFPRLNDTKAFQDFVHEHTWTQRASGYALVTVGIASVAVVVNLWIRRKL
ncbi:hypothetical protein MKEN_00629900 [Mycena kentingensis (nom. inval.)]|nr:hypothetical protein MKEN_00629900 [Mycena kentingensis (nom. inval.)]